MTTHSFEITRRQALAGLGATTALAAAGCAPANTIRAGAIEEANAIGAKRLLETVARRAA